MKKITNKEPIAIIFVVLILFRIFFTYEPASTYTLVIADHYVKYVVYGEQDYDLEQTVHEIIRYHITNGIDIKTLNDELFLYDVKILEISDEQMRSNPPHQ